MKRTWPKWKKYRYAWKADRAIRQSGCGTDTAFSDLSRYSSASGQRLIRWSSAFYQILIPEYLLHLISILYGETDVDPLASKSGKEDSVSFRSVVVLGKPGLEVSRSMEPPLPVSQRRWLNRDPLNVLQTYDLSSSDGKVVMFENDTVFG